MSIQSKWANNMSSIVTIWADICSILNDAVGTVLRPLPALSHLMDQQTFDGGSSS